MFRKQRIKTNLNFILILKLQKLRAKIKVYDPKAMKNAKKVLKKVSFCNHSYEALKGSNALVLVTEWPEFLKLDFRKIGKIMKEKVVLDGRNFLDKKKLESLGFKYVGVGY